MPRSPTRRSPLTASLFVGFVLVGCGGKLRGGTIGDDGIAPTTGDPPAQEDAAALASSQSGDAAVSSSLTLDGASVALLPLDDASLPGAPSLGGGIDPNGPCPAAVGSLRCSVEGAHLCGPICSVQCSCAGGFWSCHLPPC